MAPSKLLISILRFQEKRSRTLSHSTARVRPGSLPKFAEIDCLKADPSEVSLFLASGGGSQSPEDVVSMYVKLVDFAAVARGVATRFGQMIPIDDSVTQGAMTLP